MFHLYIFIINLKNLVLYFYNIVNTVFNSGEFSVAVIIIYSGTNTIFLFLQV